MLSNKFLLLFCLQDVSERSQQSLLRFVSTHYFLRATVSSNGLPLTDQGYKGVMIVTDYLTKFPFAVPIKSKIALEIAEQLFLIISMSYAIFPPVERA